MTENIKKQIARMDLDITQVTRTQSLLNQNQIQKLWNSTPQKYKYNRAAKGGGQWTYIKASYVRKVLDSVFGFNWSFDIETSLGEAFEVAKMTNSCVVKGTLIAQVKVDGEWVKLKKTQFGRADVKWQTVTKNGNKSRKLDDFTGFPVPLDFGNDMKAATSDCLKKCASLLGIGADVYEADEFVEISIIGADDNTAKAKETVKKLRNAREILNVKSEAVDG